MPDLLNSNALVVVEIPSIDCAVGPGAQPLPLGEIVGGSFDVFVLVQGQTGVASCFAEKALRTYPVAQSSGPATGKEADDSKSSQ